jgi:zinc/manganese transport system ATP-binding protein
VTAIEIVTPHAHGGSPPVLQVEDLGVRLGGRHILEEVTFSLFPGEFAGLIGPNGAGKTTLLRAILGLVHPTSGTVRLDGVDRDQRELGIGYVPQKLLFDPEMPLRARDVVALGLDGHRLGLRLTGARHRAARVDEVLEAVDASSFADRRVGLLSGGEQQRVLIAHALVSRPKLLLLDEPLANLDIRSEHDVVALLARIAREQGIAVLLSAHDMNSLLGVMDRVVYVAGGRAASGTTDEVVRPEVLSALYGDPVEVIHARGRIIVVAGESAQIDLASDRAHDAGHAHPHAVPARRPRGRRSS